MRKHAVTLFAAALAVLSLGAVRPATAIINGRSAGDGQFPFMAALQERDGFTFCGASVVANDWVLTASHCVADMTAAEIQVVTGRTDLSDESQGQVHEVDEVRVHPTIDAAMVHLTTPTSSAAIKLAGSSDNDLEAEGTRVTVAGWGDQLPTMGLFSTNELRYTDLKVVGDPKCAQRQPGFRGASEMCAAEVLTDSCNGDSGGPLWGVKNGVKVQVGIVSYGICGVWELPGVYTEVNNSSVSQFIAGALAAR